MAIPSSFSSCLAISLLRLFIVLLLSSSLSESVYSGLMYPTVRVSTLLLAVAAISATPLHFLLQSQHGNNEPPSTAWRSSPTRPSPPHLPASQPALPGKAGRAEWRGRPGEEKLLSVWSGQHGCPNTPDWNWAQQRTKKVLDLNHVIAIKSTPEVRSQLPYVC